MIYLKYKSGNDWKDLDIDQEWNYKVTKNVIDFKDPSQRKIDFSESFDLPSTSINDAFFEVYYDPTFTGLYYSPYSETQVALYSDSDLIIQGNLQLIEVDREAKFYKCRIFGSLKSINNVFGDRRINDLDWSAYDHIFSADNVKDSWTGAVELLDASTTDKILYPLADWGKGYGIAVDIESTPGVNVNDFYPAIHYKTLIDGLFTNNGLSLDWTNFNLSLIHI